jgi:phosphatidylserine decarboxylase
MDIVPHLSICAKNGTDRVVMGNFIAASQAQMKCCTEINPKVLSAGYKLGSVRRNPLFLTRECVYLIVPFGLEFCQYHCAEPDD